MATLTKDNRILFRHPADAGNKKRRKITLTDLPRQQAREVLSRVESLIASKQTGIIDPVTQAWLANIGDVLHAKLVSVELIERRGIRQLGALIDEFLGRRQDLKPGTQAKLDRMKQDLLSFFSKERDIRSITTEEAEKFKAHYIERGLATATIFRRLVEARTIFGEAVRLKLIAENPFATVKSRNEQPQERMIYVSPETTKQVIAAANPEWQTIIALARFAGLRCPSEVLSLRWCDVNWEANRFTVNSTKTEHHAGKAYRVVPIFAELRPYLQEAWDRAEEGATYVIDGTSGRGYRNQAKKPGGWENANLNTTLRRIIRRAGVEEWSKPFQNLRVSCATDIAERFPDHVATKWLGHSKKIADRHYRMVLESHFDAAAGGHNSGHTGSEKAQDESEKYRVLNVPKSLENSTYQGDSECLQLGVAGFERFEDSPLLFDDSESEGTIDGTLSELTAAWPYLSPSQRSEILAIARGALTAQEKRP